jgi:hypothetical protein
MHPVNLLMKITDKEAHVKCDGSLHTSKPLMKHPEKKTRVFIIPNSFAVMIPARRFSEGRQSN